jgi:hypothetical protein
VSDTRIPRESLKLSGGDLELSYKQLEATLATYLSIKPDRLATFRSRVKQLQRLEFPPGVNVGRGLKMTYSGEHLFKLVVAFELISSGLPAKSATELSERHWKEFAGGFALVALAERSQQKDRRVLAQVRVRSLAELQFGKYSAPTPSEVTICDVEALNNLLGIRAQQPFYWSLLSLTDSYSKVARVAKEVAGVDFTSWDHELEGWLPKKSDRLSLSFRGGYPDRSNLEIRRELHSIYGQDPESKTPEGEEEAHHFYKQYLDPTVPF